MKAAAAPTPAMIRRAALWAAEFDAGDLSTETRRAYESWCDADPRHLALIERMRRFDTDFEQLDSVEKVAVEQAVRTPVHRRRRAGAALLAVALVLAGGMGASRSFMVRDYLADVRTPVGTQRTLAMADGSRLVVDTASSVDLRDGARSRGVTLFRGQVMVEVAPDRTRPFVVETRSGTATALGTAYSVRQMDRAMIVTVLHSRVRVCPAKAQDDAACMIFSAGQSGAATENGVRRLPDVNVEQAAVWTKGWLEADDRPLVDILVELNRYRASPVQFSASDLHDLRVTGSYPLTDSDRAIRAMADSNGLRLSRGADGVLSLRR
jgi:transmembrane sensor